MKKKALVRMLLVEVDRLPSIPVLVSDDFKEEMIL